MAEKKCRIDGNEKAARIMPLYHEGKRAESSALEEEVLADIKASGQDLCSCPIVACSRHGNCVDCILLHRAHRDHLPCCMWDMVKARVEQPNGLCDHKKRE